MKAVKNKKEEGQKKANSLNLKFRKFVAEVSSIMSEDPNPLSCNL